MDEDVAEAEPGSGVVCDHCGELVDKDLVEDCCDWHWCEDCWPAHRQRHTLLGM